MQDKPDYEDALSFSKELAHIHPKSFILSPSHHEIIMVKGRKRNLVNLIKKHADEKETVNSYTAELAHAYHPLKTTLTVDHILAYSSYNGIMIGFTYSIETFNTLAHLTEQQALEENLREELQRVGKILKIRGKDSSTFDDYDQDPIITERMIAIGVDAQIYMDLLKGENFATLINRMKENRECVAFRDDEEYNKLLQYYNITYEEQHPETSLMHKIALWYHNKKQDHSKRDIVFKPPRFSPIQLQPDKAIEHFQKSQSKIFKPQSEETEIEPIIIQYRYNI